MDNQINYKTKENILEIRDYINRFKNLSPEQILQYLGEMRDFFYNNMGKEGRKIFEQLRKSGLERVV